jgi:hypothetical protein
MLAPQLAWRRRELAASGSRRRTWPTQERRTLGGGLGGGQLDSVPGPGADQNQTAPKAMPSSLEEQTRTLADGLADRLRQAQERMHRALAQEAGLESGADWRRALVPAAEQLLDALEAFLHDEAIWTLLGASELAIAVLRRPPETAAWRDRLPGSVRAPAPPGPPPAASSRDARSRAEGSTGGRAGASDRRCRAGDDGPARGVPPGRLRLPPPATLGRCQCGTARHRRRRGGHHRPGVVTHEPAFSPP